MAELTHSAVLFTNDSGEPLKFYMVPCRERAELRTLIEHGGGQISGKCNFDSIKLCLTGVVCYSDGYHDSTYIRDCIEKGYLLDMEGYQVKNSSVKAKSISHLIQKKKRLRNPYTAEEDNAILMYVAKTPMPTAGNSLWKKMEKEKITSHPWQSMKCRYLKNLQDRLPEFIDIIRKQRRESNSSSDDCKDISCSSDDDESIPVTSPRKRSKQFISDESSCSESKLPNEICQENVETVAIETQTEQHNGRESGGEGEDEGGEDTERGTGEEETGGDDAEGGMEGDEEWGDLINDEYSDEQICKDMKKIMKKYGLNIAQCAYVYSINNNSTKEVSKWLQNVEEEA